MQDTFRLDKSNISFKFKVSHLNEGIFYYYYLFHSTDLFPHYIHTHTYTHALQICNYPFQNQNN